jgi:hypothetical protein
LIVSHPLQVKKEIIAFVTHGLLLLLSTRRLTAAVVYDLSTWVANKMHSFQEHYEQ